MIGKGPQRREIATVSSSRYLALARLREIPSMLCHANTHPRRRRFDATRRFLLRTTAIVCAFSICVAIRGCMWEGHEVGISERVSATMQRASRKLPFVFTPQSRDSRAPAPRSIMQGRFESPCITRGSKRNFNFKYVIAVRCKRKMSKSQLSTSTCYRCNVTAALQEADIRYLFRANADSESERLNY